MLDVRERRPEFCAIVWIHALHERLGIGLERGACAPPDALVGAIDIKGASEIGVAQPDDSAQVLSDLPEARLIFIEAKREGTESASQACNEEGCANA